MIIVLGTAASIIVIMGLLQLQKIVFGKREKLMFITMATKGA